MLTSVMRGDVGEPVIVVEQTTGTTGKVEKSARIVEKRASVRERMSAAEMLARRYGILSPSESGDGGVEFYGEDKIAPDDGAIDAIDAIDADNADHADNEKVPEN